MSRHARPTLPPQMELRLRSVDTGDGQLKVTDAYLDRYWTPVVGPAVIALARFLFAERQSEWTVADMAKALGFGSSTRRLTATIHRAEEWRFVTLVGTTLTVNAYVHEVPRHVAVARLPERIAHELLAVSVGRHYGSGS